MANNVPVPAYIHALADAITAVRGWHPAARSFLNNNPGDLPRGDVGLDDKGFGIFSTYAAGREAFLQDLMGYVANFPHWSLWLLLHLYGWGVHTRGKDAMRHYVEDAARALDLPPGIALGNIAGWWEKHGLTWQPMNFETKEAEIIIFPAQPQQSTKEEQP